MADELLLADFRAFDAATLTSASGVATGLGLANLQTVQPGDVCRFTSPAAAFVVIDMVTAIAANCFLALFSNATSAATVQVRGATSEANLTASPGYNSTAVSMHMAAGLDWPWYNTLIYSATPQTFRWWRFDFADAANPDGVLDIGRLGVCAAYVSPKGIAFGERGELWDGGRAIRSVNGGLHPVFGEGWREWEGELSSLKRDELFELRDRRRNVGATRPVFATYDPATATYQQEQAIYGLMQQIMEFPNRDLDTWTANFRVAEILPNRGIGNI